MGQLVDVRTVFVVSALGWFACGGASVAVAGYSQSAHADASYGVKRTGGAAPLPEDYARGNCAHCHEQHGSIGGAEPSPADGTPSDYLVLSTAFDATATTGPYTADDVSCFACHSDGASVQQGGAVVNYDYAAAFGGYSGGPDSILDAFNQPGESTPSYHNLYDIWTLAKAEFSWFGAEHTPCSACHNVHLARRNHADPGDPTDTAISRPIDHDNLWGDGAGEWMSDYSAEYQAPYYYNSTSTYEPDGGSGPTDGSLTPNYDSFCNDCHAVAVYSTTLGRNVLAIDWEEGTGGDTVGAGDKHGASHATLEVVSRAPYGVEPGYVLSCLDCHEAHGSPNGYLIRRSINGQALGATIGTGRDGSARGNQCRQCHEDDASYLGNASLVNQWKTTHHGGAIVTDMPYKTNQESSCGCHDSGTPKPPIACEICHYHGGYVPNPANDYPGTVTPYYSPYLRRTF